MSKKILIFIIVCIVGNSCTEKKNAVTNNDVIDVDFSKEETLYLSNIADSISYVQLETTEDCVLGIIKTIRYNKGIYYISDMTYSIYLFDEVGKYMAKLNKLGQGPGEYTSIETFDVDNVLAKPIGIWNNYYIGVLDPQYIEAARKLHKKNIASDTILDKMNVDFQKIIKSNDSDPNQILVFYKLNFSKVK